MAKTVKTKLEKAKEELRAAQKVYDELVRHDVNVLTDEQRVQRDQVCREALAAKQKAAEKVRNIKLGKPILKPESEDE